MSRAIFRRAEGRRAHGTAADRGSVTLFVAIFAVAALALLVLLVDGGTALNAKERAADIAEQAARAAANQVNVANLRAANPTVVIGSGACAKAATLVSQYQVTSNTAATLTNCDAPEGATTATVSVTVTTTPIIGGFFGSFSMSSAASASPVCGITAGGQC